MESDEPRTPPGSGTDDPPAEASADVPDDAAADGSTAAAAAPPAKEATATPAEEASAASEEALAASEEAATGTDRPATKGRPPTRATPPTEQEINSPSLRELWLLGVVFLVTAASWGSARLACNYHPPQSRPPPEIATDRLARTPKGSAVELAHRYRTKNFEGARELAKGALALEIEKKVAECEQQGAVCVKDRSKLEMTVLTTGVITELTADSAVAQITHHIDGAAEKVEVRVERDGALWRAVSTRKL